MTLRPGVSVVWPFKCWARAGETATSNVPLGHESDWRPPGPATLSHPDPPHGVAASTKGEGRTTRATLSLSEGWPCHLEELENLPCSDPRSSESRTEPWQWPVRCLAKLTTLLLASWPVVSKGRHGQSWKPQMGGAPAPARIQVPDRLGQLVMASPPCSFWVCEEEMMEGQEKGGSKGHT